MTRSIDTPEIEVRRPYLIVDHRAVMAVLEVSPVNLDLKTDRDHEVLHQVFQTVLDTISYPLYIYSRQTPADLDDYVDMVKSNPGHSELRSEYTEYCQRIAVDGFVRTDHFVVIRVVGGKYENTGKELYRRLQEVKSAFAGSEFEVSQITGDALHQFASQVINPAPEPSEHYCATANHDFDEYRKLVYIDEYPSEIEFGWPRYLLRVDGLVDVLQVVQPVNVDKAVRKLRRHSETLDAEIAAFLAQGHKGVNELERALDDAEWFLDLLARQDCNPLKYGAYVTAHGPTSEETDATFDRVTTQLGALQLRFQEPGFRNDHAYYTDSPFYDDRLNETLLMPSVSAATGLPFGTQPFSGTTGVLYGVDAADRTPILVNRFGWDSHSMAVMGTLGSGKSYLAHLELLRSILVYPDIQIIVVDPKKEYRQTVEALGGDHRFVVHGKEYSFDKQVVGFEVEERGEFENVAALVDLVRQIYSATSQNQQRTIVLIDEARLLLKDDAGRHVLNQFVLEARDINVAVHLVTQSWSHFADSAEGSNILNHVPGKLFFRHEDAPDSPILSRQEELDIQGLRSGEEASYSEAYLHVSNAVHTKLQIGSTALEHRIFDSEPKQHEQLEAVE
ncbi:MULTISPECIES: helicase HerA domain-containing protein [Halorussus]|uniref:helicase HerA domain-containing protein n=1 Tax=Halorussus TaxID=1070314 RepID=UPI0020A18FB9|nr:DUF87 domain-containing protein [Halorussus vallis]USZ77563.1 DUF87 domain-containing protein [Halorussus vallis]